MAKPQLFQGTWEEISAHAEEFKGRKDLTLIVPRDDEPDKVEFEGVSLAEALKGRTGLVSFEPADLSQDTGKKFAALLAQKQRGECK